VLACFTPFCTAEEREHAGCHHRLFFAQTEFCDNLVFCRRAALGRLGEPLFEPIAPSASKTRSRRSFGRSSKRHHGKLQTEIEHMDLANPVGRE
jgi:hypothetical protein